MEYKIIYYEEDVHCGLNIATYEEENITNIIKSFLEDRPEGVIVSMTMEYIKN